MCPLHPLASSDQNGCLACWYRSSEAAIDRSTHEAPFVQPIALKPPQREILITPRVRAYMNERDPALRAQNVTDASVYWRSIKAPMVEPPPVIKLRAVVIEVLQKLPEEPRMFYKDRRITELAAKCLLHDCLRYAECRRSMKLARKLKLSERVPR